MSAARRSLEIAAALTLAMPGAAHGNDPVAPPPAVPIQAEDTDMAKLENAFWACDYIATTQGILATPAATCRYVTEELKQQKFNGSFSQFLEWWRANKVAEHRRLARLVER